MARAAKAKASKSGTKVKVAKKPALKAVEAKKASTAVKLATKPAAKIAAPAQSSSKKPVVEIHPTGKKQVSQKLLETIERRKLEKAGQKGFFAKPPGRRGRRPKNVEYTPGQNEEEAYVYESQDERLEYDTGIRVAAKAEDSMLSMERFEEFDEELNFDW